MKLGPFFRHCSLMSSRAAFVSAVNCTVALRYILIGRYYYLRLFFVILYCTFGEKDCNPVPSFQNTITLTVETTNITFHFYNFLLFFSARQYHIDATKKFYNINSYIIILFSFFSCIISIIIIILLSYNIILISTHKDNYLSSFFSFCPLFFLVLIIIYLKLFSELCTIFIFFLFVSYFNSNSLF